MRGHPEYAGMRMTNEQFLALGETPERYELINGVVVMSPSPTSKHQRAIRRLLAQLDDACDRMPGLEALSEYDISLGPGLILQPDVVVFAPGRFSDAAGHSVVPDLAIEVISPSSRRHDLTIKLQSYDRFGVGEYWVIDPDDGSVQCWRRRAPRGAFVSVPVEGDLLPSSAIPGLVIDLRPIRRISGPGPAAPD